MKEIRLHGRGGQGVVMDAEMLPYAFVLEGSYASALMKTDQRDPSDL